MIFRKAALDRLSSPEQLDALMTITSPRSWLAFVALATLLGAAAAWATLTTIPLRVTTPAVFIVDGESSGATARFFVSIEESRRLQAGMPVALSSLTGQRRQLSGTITAVGVAPVTPEQLSTTPSGDYLLAGNRGTGGGAIAVDVALPGGAALLQSGALATATITLGHVRPIDMVIPFR